MLTIGRLGRATGVKVPTIRYYEQIGLLPRAGRSAGNQRLYGRAALDRLTFVRHARQLGFPLEAIRELLDLADHPERPCADADAIARRQLEQVRSRITRLEALRGELERMLGECAGTSIARCRVLEVLRDHGACLAEHAPDEP